MSVHYINSRFNSIDTNAIDLPESREVLFKNKKDLPTGDNIVVFSGIISENYKPGDKSRNGYKYKQDGWELNNYEKLPIVLRQHDDRYGGIGYTQELWIDNDGNLNGLFYVDLDLLEDRHAKQVKKGMVTSVSTGAITIEDGFENSETGEIMDEEEAIEKHGESNVWKAYFGMSDILTYIVTKAELVEQSLVTIGSNAGAIARQVNTLTDEMHKKAELLKNTLPSIQDTEMKVTPNFEFVDADEAETKTNDVTTEVDTPEVSETTPEVEENKEVETEEVTEENNTEVEDLKAKNAELEDKISELEAKITELTENKVKSEKEAILANAPKATLDAKKGKTMETMDDFVQKYSTK